MKEFWAFVRQYVFPYKRYVFRSIFANIAAALLNIGAFSLIIPILSGLFGTDDVPREFIPWAGMVPHSVSDVAHSVDVLGNNFMFYVQQMVVEQGASFALLALCGYLVVITLLKSASAYLALYWLTPISTGVVCDLRNSLNKKVLSLPLSFMSEEYKGDILARMSGDVNEVELSVIGELERLVRNPVLLVLYFTTLILLSWQLTIFVLFVLPIAGYAMGVIGRKLRQQSVEAHERWGMLMSMTEETLSGLRIIKAFGGESFIQSRFTQSNDRYRRTVKQMYARQYLAHPVSELLGTIAMALILWYGGNLIFSGAGPISAPTFIFYLIIFYHVINPAKELSRSGYAIEKGMASVRRIQAVLDKEEEPIKRDATPCVFQDRIEFNNVSFAYRDTPVLKQINLTVQKGQTVAFVGPSGAGKTTLVDLLPRFYDPQQGAITIDGVDLRDLNTAALRRLIGYVNQTPILFNDTIRNNIAFSNDTATMQEIEQAARMANAHGFIEKLSEGYDFRIGDGGSKLSGGERQRLSIARALLRNPEILILDEATSALDYLSEQLVQEAIDHLLEQRTTFVIAHRLSTILHADKICVMDHGEIVQQGTHQELLAQGGLYATLYHTQFAKQKPPHYE